MSKLTMLLVILALVASLCYASFLYGKSMNFQYGPTVTNLEKMGHLVSLRVHLSDIVDEDWTWGMKVLEQKVLYVVRGDALVACDVRGARILEKDEARRWARIQLPRPKVLGARVNMHMSKPYSSSFWLTQTTQAKMLQKALEKGQDRIEVGAGCDENVATAKANARQVLTSFWEMLGWHIDVVFDDETDKL